MFISAILRIFCAEGSTDTVPLNFFGGGRDDTLKSVIVTVKSLHVGGGNCPYI